MTKNTTGDQTGTYDSHDKPTIESTLPPVPFPYSVKKAGLLPGQTEESRTRHPNGRVSSNMTVEEVMKSLNEGRGSLR